MKKQLLILFFLAQVYSCELILKPNHKYKKPKEHLFKGNGDITTKYFIFPASYVYDCDCKSYVGENEIFANTCCPFCRINNPEAQQRFKNILFVNAVLRHNLKRANKLLKKGAKITTEDLHKFTDIYYFLEQFPEQVDKNNLDHYQLMRDNYQLLVNRYKKNYARYKVSSDFYRGINAYKLADEKLMSQEHFIELLNFCLDTNNNEDKLANDIKHNYLWELKKYATKYPDKLALCKEFDKDKRKTDLIEKFVLDYNVDAKQLPNFDKNFKANYGGYGHSIKELLKINPNYLFDNFFIERASIDKIKDFIKLRPDLKLKDFKEFASKVNTKIFCKYDSYRCQEIFKMLNEELPKDEKGNDFQMRIIMLDKTEIPLIDGIRKNSPVNKNGFDDFSLSILYNAEKFFDKYLPVSDLEHFDNDGRTPLMMALSTNQHKMLREILKRKANYNARDFDGLSCYNYARNSDSYKTKYIFYSIVIRDIIEKNVSKFCDYIKTKLPKKNVSEHLGNLAQNPE
jgi:ankyrin repeat protein